MSWLYLPVQVVDYLEADCSDGERSATSRKTRTAKKSCKRGSKTAISTTRPSGTTRERSTGVLGLDSWMSSLRDSRANHSAERESNSASKTSAISGRIPFASLERSGRNGSFWKMFQGSFVSIISDEYLQTWPRAGLMRDGIVFLHQPSARLTRETGFGLLPTPTDVSKGGGSSRSGNRIDEIPTLQGMARRGKWPTPRANDAEKRGNFDAMNKRNGLAGAVRIWPTPTVGDSRSARNTTANRKTIPPSGIHSGDTLVDAVTKFPTPTVNDSKNNGGPSQQRRAERGFSSTLNQEIGGRLNPRWVEWLMGFLISWTNLEPLPKERWNDWLEKHGAQTSTTDVQGDRMQPLWRDPIPSETSQRREFIEQRTKERRDSVPTMPHKGRHGSGAMGQGENSDSETMRDLREKVSTTQEQGQDLQESRVFERTWSQISGTALVISYKGNRLQELWKYIHQGEGTTNDMLKVLWEYIGMAQEAWWAIEPPNIPRITNVCAFRVAQLKALGNAQVPSVVRAAWLLLSVGFFLKRQSSEFADSA
jgi:hypothetical protein